MRASFIFIIFATCFALKLYKQSLKTDFRTRSFSSFPRAPVPNSHRRSAGHLGFRGNRKLMFCCVFSSGVLGTVCGAIGLRRGSQSDVLLRFSSGVLGTVCGAFGFRRGSQSAVCFACFRAAIGNGLRGHWEFCRGGSRGGWH